MSHLFTSDDQNTGASASASASVLPMSIQGWLPLRLTGLIFPLPSKGLSGVYSSTIVQNQVDYILCSWRWRSSIQSAKTTPGADCGSDHEVLIAKFRLKLKKVGKTTRPFRHDLNQFPYDYTVEVTNRLKGLDLIDRVPEELCTEVHDIVQVAVIKTIPKKNKCKNAKWLSEEDLWTAEKRRDAKGKRENERYIHLNAEFQRIVKRDKKVFLTHNAKK